MTIHACNAPNIACWSGPRNLSTAMMYSFSQVTTVVDEPFYAAFLRSTGLDHPMRKEILESQPSDPAKVVEGLPKAPHYLKLMTHHHLPETPIDWAHSYKHVFLIRHPARVLASYLAKRESPTFEDIGFQHQADLFDRLGGVVIDSADIRADPPLMLRRLCDAIELDYDPAMLNWPAGGNAADGVWAAHWYGAVHRSTGFAGTEGPLPQLEHPVLDQAMPFYEKLTRHRLMPC